jgi:hypothetical protein
LGESEDKAIFQGSGGASGHFDVEVSGRESSPDDGLDEELGLASSTGSSPGYGTTADYKPLSAYTSSGAPLRERLEALREVVK